MVDAETEAEHFLRRWRSLPPDDRNAILDALPEERIRQMEELIVEVEDAEAVASREFAVYSLWLGPLVERAASPSQDQTSCKGSAIKPVVWEAQRNAHSKIRPDVPTVSGLHILVARIKQSLSSWMEPL